MENNTEVSDSIASENLFLNLWNFIKDPNLKKEHGKSFFVIIKELAALYAIKMILAFTVLFFLSLVLTIKNDSIQELIATHSKTEIFFLIVLFGPLVEELIFRLSLRYNPLFLSTSISFFSYYILRALRSKISFLDDSNSIYISIGISLIIGVIFYFIIRKTAIEKYWKLHFKWIYYASVVLFAFLHVFNYELSNSDLFFIPLIVFPQFLDGIVLGYIRIKNGFWYSVLFHSFNNFVVFFITILFR
ncbi:CPBP family intramembrane metalloprotease [Joostella atrarenae]|uniref:CPBP family intramembrane metalloprotease n=1 Tax=Joostella atrarenae TaxID=679257 RepID=A0ABS9J0R5_9FLAO|nr:CPBP family glutamic-type intramembrane protease [Joostella atrarenae]MCF8714017.1 CPBP family intramembrane metalloprotease [Joostella atrarenae]